MTEPMHKCLTFVISYIKTHGYSPSFDEMQTYLGMSSRSEIHRVVGNLKRDGYVTTRDGVARSIMPTNRDVSAGYALLVAHYGAEAVKAEVAR